MHECTQQEVISEIRELTRELKTRNEYSAKHEEKMDKMVEELVRAREDHDKRITALEVLPGKVSQLIDDETINIKRLGKDKVQKHMSTGLLIVIILSSLTLVSGVVGTLYVFLNKVIQIIPTK
ncbi:MAG: hypothetical protein N3I35_06780 [Clostridia bacterium]|nr:hypothetical protein [Clostridia bacterium]